MAEIYVPGGFDFMGAANQMMQFRNSQQAQQANALQMQYTMEDRARAEQGRKIAAGNALADQARKRELLEIYSNFGVTPAVIGQRGQSYSGTGVANDPYADIQNKLLTKGFASQAGDIAELQNKNLTGKKTTADIGLVTEQTNEKTADVVSKYITLHKDQLNSAPNYETLIALTKASYTPGHPMAAWLAKNGVSQEDAVAELIRRRDEGIPFEETRALMARGATNAAKDAADLASSQASAKSSEAAATSSLATAAKTKFEINNPGFTIEDVVLPSGETIKVTVNTRTGKVERLMLGDETLAPKAVPLTESQVKQEALLKGKSDVTQILGMLLKDYNSLEEMQAIPSDERPVAENVPAYLGATALGQEAEKAAGTKAQTLRTNVQSNARFLLTAIKNATGMSAQEMNSIPELQALQEAVTKPTQSIQSVRNIIANVDKLYGTGGLKIDVAPKTEAAPKTDDKPKIAKLSDIEHTAKLKKLSIEEVKKRVRDLGMTIEGE